MILFLAMLDTQEEKSKFAKLYETYRYLLWYVANEILRDPDDAEDAVQETYFALTRHMDKIEDVDSTKTRNFLVTIVKSKAIDILRKKTRGNLEYLEEIEADETWQDALDAYIECEQLNRIVTAICSLDENYRVVLEYRFLHGLSEKETASILGLTEKNLSVRTSRARKKLKELLEKEAKECCEWLVKHNRYILIRDKDWEKI